MNKTMLTTGLGVLGSLAAPLVAHATDYNYGDYYPATSSSSSGAAGAVILVFVLGFFALMLALFIFWIVMLVDALKRTNWASESDKTLWTIVLAVSLPMGLFGIASIVYYFVVKRPLDKKKSRKKK